MLLKWLMLIMSSTVEASIKYATYSKVGSFRVFQLQPIIQKIMFICHYIEFRNISFSICIAFNNPVDFPQVWLDTTDPALTCHFTNITLTAQQMAIGFGNENYQCAIQCSYNLKCLSFNYIGNTVFKICAYTLHN